jgi:hypothetical protein
MARRSKTSKRSRGSQSAPPPDWAKVKSHFKTVMKDVKKEMGKSVKYGSQKVERGVEKKVLPSLKRARRKLEGLIKEIERRTA